MLRLAAIPLVLALLVIAGIHLSGADSAGDRADFSFVNRGDNNCLDPNGMSWMQDIRIAYALWEGLYALDPATLKPIPGTADRIEIDPSRKVYTFHIRQSARWSNGQKVTAEDLVFAWRRMLDTPGNYSYLFKYIKGAGEYMEAQQAYVAERANGARTPPAPDFASVGIVSPDEQTLVVTLADPIPFFPALCAFPPFFPLNRQSMQPFAKTDEKTGVTTYDQTFTRPPNLVSNGPYRLAQWSFKRRVRLVASDYYWDRGNVKCRTIDEISAEDALAAYRLYDRGDVDWLADTDPELAADIISHGGRPDLHIFPAFGTYYYSLNCNAKLPGGRDNPLAQVAVRQALAMSIDRTPIVREVGRLGQPPAFDYVPPGVFAGYRSPAGLPYDPAAARKLLAQAGYPGGRGFPKLTILFNNESVHADVAQIVRRQWLNDLGIEVELEGVEVKDFSDRHQSQDYDIARAGWYGDYDDPSTFTDKFKSDSDENECKWKNAEYDRLCAAAQAQADPLQRMELLSQAEGILLNQAPIIPLYRYVNAYMYRENVKGIPLNPMSMVMFKAVER